MPSSRLQPPIQAATEILRHHGITPDRCDILQDGNTLVLRMTESVVARIVQEKDGPRQGTAWFARENAIAQHLTTKKAPVIPLHPELPPGPHLQDGYPINFWQYVTAIDEDPVPESIGRTLFQCHAALRDFPGTIPHLAILHESLQVLRSQKHAFEVDDYALLEKHLAQALSTLQDLPHQPLHGDAHMGNLMNTTIGLLWTDWEDAFSGPIEWDLASIIWNTKFLEQREDLANSILSAYVASGGSYQESILQQCFAARAAVMTAWYPVLYPNPDSERLAKLQQRMDYLKNCA